MDRNSATSILNSHSGIAVNAIIDAYNAGVTEASGPDSELIIALNETNRRERANTARIEAETRLFNAQAAALELANKFDPKQVQTFVEWWNTYCPKGNGTGWESFGNVARAAWDAARKGLL